MGIAKDETVRRLVLTALLICVACTPTTYNPLRDRPDYVTRVLEDVRAMLEGMDNAHAADRVRLRDPNYRSSQHPRFNGALPW